MNRSRSICLLFILITIAVIICFWFGFLYGKETQRQEDLVQLTEVRLEAERAAHEALNLEKQLKEAKNSILELEEENTQLQKESVPTNVQQEKPRFYIKPIGEYVGVYVSATDEVYFESDIMVYELPYEIQKEVEDGMHFYDLESVYTFLENYSS